MAWVIVINGLSAHCSQFAFLTAQELGEARRFPSVLTEELRAAVRGVLRSPAPRAAFSCPGGVMPRLPSSCNKEIRLEIDASGLSHRDLSAS